MRARDTSIYKSAYELAKELFIITMNYDKRYRRTIAERMQNECLDLLNYIILTNSERNNDTRLKYMDVLNNKSSAIMTLMNLSVELHLLSYKEEARLSRYLVEYAKQLTGWRKYVLNRKSNEGANSQGS